MDCSHLQRDAAHPTGTVDVKLTAAGHPSYTIHERVAYDFPLLDRRRRQLAARTDAVTFGTLAQRTATGAEAIAGFLAACPPGCVRLLDVNLRQRFWSDGLLRRSLRAATALKLNDEELPAVAAAAGVSGATADAVLRRLAQRFELRLACLTRGAGGCLLVADGAHSVEHPGTPRDGGRHGRRRRRLRCGRPLPPAARQQPATDGGGGQRLRGVRGHPARRHAVGAGAGGTPRPRRRGPTVTPRRQCTAAARFGSGPVTATLVDTHCHLDDARFAADRDAVVERAAAAGVTRAVIPATSIAAARAALQLAERHAGLRVAVGVHPLWCATHGSLSEAIAELRDLAQAPPVVAIGEIGLDFLRGPAPALQTRWLDAQLDLAAAAALPVILHNRDATPELLARLRAWGERATLPQPAGVLHAFSGGPAPPTGRSPPASTSASAACSRSATPPTCASSRRGCPASGWCWKPTRPTSPPSRCAGAATSRRSCATSPRGWLCCAAPARLRSPCRRPATRCACSRASPPDPAHTTRGQPARHARRDTAYS